MNYSKLEDDELVKKINECYRQARDHSKAWRRECVDLHKFRSGHQWSDDDKAALEEQGRPPVVFNRAGTIIDAVIGNEISNRQEIRFLPRTNDDSAFNEMATNVVRWHRQECNAEDEESDAFENLLIGGMGWIETRVDYDESGEPIIVMDAVDPVEMYWDTNARKHNLEDRQWQIREKWIPTEEAKATWPEISELQPAVSMAPDLSDDIRNADPPFYERESTGFDKKAKTVRVIEYEWIEFDPHYVIQNPITGKVETINAETFKRLEKKAPELKSSKIKKPKVYRAYSIGNSMLERGDGPRKNWFNYECITGKRDTKDNTFYGLMRGMKDPQEWGNKFFSQIMHIVNSNSKGGFFWEEGALVNEQNAKEDLARPDGMVKLKAGGLQKIKERQMFQFPSSIDKMMEFAISSIRDVPGVNLELLGMANREQAGVVESQRSRQALTVLAPLFSNLRRYRKNQGKMSLYFIREYIPEGRLIRVVGEDGAKVVPMMKDPLMVEYDVIVEQSPTSPNSKTEAWLALRDVLPVLQAAGMQPPMEIVDVLPLPESMTAKWKETIKKGPPPEVAQKMQEMDKMIQDLQQENQQLQMGQQIDMAKLQSANQIKQQEMAMKQEQWQNDMKLRIEEMNAEHQMKVDELAFSQQIAIEELKLEKEKIAEEINLAREKASAEISIKKDAHVADAMNQMEANLSNTELVRQQKEEFSEQKTNEMKALSDSIISSMSAIAGQFKEGIEAAASKPRILVFDKAGNPIGSKPVERLN